MLQGLRRAVWRAGRGGGLLLLAGRRQQVLYTTTLLSSLTFKQLFVLCALAAAILAAVGDQATGISLRFGLAGAILVAGLAGSFALLYNLAEQIEADESRLKSDIDALMKMVPELQQLADELRPHPRLQQAAANLAADAAALLTSLKQLSEAAATQH